VVVSTVVTARSDRYTQDVFRSLADGERQLVESLTGRSLSLPPNRLLVDKGEVGVVLYRIASGWAYRFRNSSNGCRQILDFLLPGEIVGLQAAMLGVIDHSVRSLTPLHVSTIDARLVAEAFRIAFLMLNLYHRQAARAETDPLTCPFPLRRQHLADALGLTGAHINRTLNRLREDGVARLENQLLSIRDLPRLTELATSGSRSDPASPAPPTDPAA